MPYSILKHGEEKALELRRAVSLRWAAKDRKNNSQRHASNCKRFYDKNSERFAEYRKTLKARTYVKNWRIENKTYYKNYILCHRLFRDYGITLDERDALFAENNGLCHCCSKAKATHIDHCHTTNKIRGAICHKCNAGIGLLGDTTEMVKHAYEYLTRAEARI